MCTDRPKLFICACGANFAGCDTVEALLHITQKSGDSHYWTHIYTGVFEGGRLLDPPNANPVNYSEYLKLKYKDRSST